jgi:hypothetical protein
MSPQAGLVLMEEIAPRLKTVVPYIKAVGCEDAEELFQDGLAMAARMLDQLEQRGKQVTPGNVAYYVTLHLRSGRRSHGCGRTDALASTTQLDHKSVVLSLEEEVGYDPELDEAIRLGDLLTCSKDDAAMAAGRNLDWEEFLETHDYRYGVIAQDMASGKTMRDAAKDVGLGYSSAVAMKNKMASELREFMGCNAIADAAKIPSWRSNLQVDREKMACRADRRRG